MAQVLSDFLAVFGPHDAAAITHALEPDSAWPPVGATPRPSGHRQPAAGIGLWWRGEPVVEAGADAGGLGLSLEPDPAARAPASGAGRVIERWLRQRDPTCDDLRGRFAFVLWDDAGRRVLAITDRARSCTLSYLTRDGLVAIATDQRLLLAAGLVPRVADPQSIYHYLNLSYVPAPHSALRDVARVRPGYVAEWRQGVMRSRAYWDATYPADLDGDDARKAEALRTEMTEVVPRYGLAAGDGWGTFLSGGTDSSSIASLLTRGRDHAVKTFSIGFDEPGYDELSFARLAAQTFGLDAHDAKVTERDAVDEIVRLVRAFDDPFGNSSAIPTAGCASLARAHGVSLLVAGDGGDEIFGGNERYRKDVIFERFHGAPAPVRWFGRLTARSLGPLDHRLANRVKNFVHRGSLPNPDRFYSDDSFASDHFEEMLSPGYRALVERDASLDLQRQVYHAASATSDLHRLMYLDLKMTIADNDVVKVTRAAKLAGVQVAFPYLDPRLVDFTGRLPASDKVRGLNKRHLFKLATAEILPEAIRAKKKQGFGLPVSVWLRRGGPLRELVHDVVLSGRAAGRGMIEPAFVRRLLERHERGAWDHGAELYLLLMLELWFREYLDA